MSLTVFGVWATTTYESTMVLSRRRTARYLLMGVMVIGLIINASITPPASHQRGGVGGGLGRALGGGRPDR